MSGQYVIPVPYGRHRPRRMRTPALLRETRQDLRDQPGFADARAPDDSHDVPGAFTPGSVEAVQELLQLAFAADERGALRRRGPVRFRKGAPRPQGTERGHRLGLALRRDRLARFVLDRVAREPFGERADDDLAGLRSRLQPGGDVDGVARHQEVALLARPGDHLAAVHADPQREGEPEIPTEVGDRVAHRERRPRRPFGVIFV